jgi:hypothetical protein
VNSEREFIESKRDGLMAFDKSVCAEFWDSIGSKKFLGFEQSLLKNEFMELKAKVCPHTVYEARPSQLFSRKSEQARIRTLTYPGIENKCIVFC